MYAIYIDGKLLYSPVLTQHGHAVLNPKLTVELNKAGSLTFLLPPNNIEYGNIQKLKSIVTVEQDGEEIFRGRVLHDTRDFYNRKDVYCEGELSFLVDSIQRPYSFTGSIADAFTQLVNNHNEQVDEFKRFTVGIIDEFVTPEEDEPETVEDGDEGNSTDVTIESTDYSNTYDELISKFVNQYGGYLRIRVEGGVRYLDYVTSYGTLCDQTIEFGVNLLDISEYISADEVFTVLVPIGTSSGTSSSDISLIPSCDDCDQYMTYSGEGKYTCSSCGKEITRNLGGAAASTSGDMTIESAPALVAIPDGITRDGDHIEDEAAVALFGRIWRVQKWNDVPDGRTLLNLGVAYLQAGIEMAVSLTIKGVDLHFLNVDTERIKLGSNVRVVSPPHNLDREFLCSGISIDLVSPDKTEFSLGSSHTTLTETQVNSSRAVQEVTSVARNTSGQMTKAGLFKILTNNGANQGIFSDEETGDIYINASYIKSGTLTLGGDNAVLRVLNAEGIVCATIDENGVRILDGEIVATSGSLENMTIFDEITISSKTHEDARNMPLVSIETIEDDDLGTYYRIAFGESTNRTTPLVFYGSTIEFSAPSGLTFTSDNIIFNGPVEVSDIYVNKSWTPLTLINNFENKTFEADQLEYRAIGKHVYIRGAVKFPDDVAWTNNNGKNAIMVASLPATIRPKRSCYGLRSCSGARIARIFAHSDGRLAIEWIRLLADGSYDTTTTGMWISMNMDYWID